MSNLVQTSQMFIKKHRLIVILIVTIVFFTLVSDVFLTLDNLQNILIQNTYLIIAAMGAAIVFYGGGIDLSIGYQISLVGGIISGLFQFFGFSVPQAIIGGLLTGILLGFINGIFSIILKVHTMITTLATMTVFQGLAYLLFQSKPIYVLPQSFRLFGQGSLWGIPISIMIALFMIFLCDFILNQMVIGKYIYVIGENNDAGKYAGIKVRAVKVFIFVACGFFSAVAAIVLLGRTGSASITIGVGTEFTCLTAIALSCLGINTNRRKIINVVISIFIIDIIVNGMQLIGLGIYPQYLIKGIILLAIISSKSYQGILKF